MPALLALSITHLSSLPLFHSPQGQVGKPVALKFDEYSLDFKNPADENARLSRYARQLKREKSVRAYVLAYTPRILNYYGSNYWDISANRCLTTQAELTHRYGIEEQRLTCADGGVREKATVELWILPRGASPPTPRPEFQESDIVHCYPFLASGEIYALKRGTPLKFTTGFTLGKPSTPVTYLWSVSSGKIIDGQGQDTITVDISEATGEEVKAEVEVKGLSTGCQNRSAYTTVVGVAPFKLSEFEENFPESLQINLDNLAAILQKEAQLEGHIIVYGGRVGRRGHAQSRIERAKSYLTGTRGLAPDRYTVIEGGYRERPMFEIWLTLRNGQRPLATPSVAPQYVKFVGSSPKREQLR